ncbi:MAG: 4-hydroxy-4-methyl-2-oxoglutarate aldolase [Thermomicrobiales bacterium]|nr:4-hydroxy-4-methyl-2-oxoglutarate aldolase [Thermomicrobiales bacterium]MEA2583280.1 4-hydroxy-4-methyl-2-oxoglutarate aldolase [Thermomicrobiales bacterium]
MGATQYGSVGPRKGGRLDDGGERIALYDRMARELYVAVISDILDSLGYRNQVMQASIRPVDPGSNYVLVGRAATIQCTPQYEVPLEPYTGVIAAIDSLQPGDVAVIGTGGHEGAAYWGELFSNAALARGARGTVIDGFHRDTRKVLELGYPLFSTGARPFDSAGRATVSSHGRPVVCGGVLVRPNDVVFAEIDGIAVIPHEVAAETVARAFEKASKEDRCRDDLRAGALLGEVWKKYKVL